MPGSDLMSLACRLAVMGGGVCGWQTIRQTTASGEVTLHLQATRKTGHCPECLKCSTSVHSRRRRRTQHLPCSGQAIWLIFAVRHWYCRNPSCSRKIFAESLEHFAGPRQQASQSLQKLQHQLGLISGGEAGRRAATAAGLRTGAISVTITPRLFMLSCQSIPFPTG